ncbi:MAG TPA: deoxyhypusine synthase family protein [Candidatus Omnitrophota bacterium]|nr:deoxyhypusine synthase family protein [Candidatus Omnitrophota bacterium]
MKTMRTVKTYSVKKRLSKVAVGDCAVVPARGKSFSAFFDSFPRILKAADLHAIADATAAAARRKKAVVFMAGAHVIKCGLSPVIIELMKRRVISCVCLNGAGVIHDFELAYQGKTSEDVAASLINGSFGMGKETADFINTAVTSGVANGLGFGKAVSEKMVQAQLPFNHLSLLANAYTMGVPVFVFVAVGTDIIHQHPSFNGAAAGEGSARDFRSFSGVIPRLNKGGVVLNFGSAVIMPEVFLKALNLARNVGNQVKDFTTANFDMIHHYRPQHNVVSRPVIGGGKGYYIIGHHEIMLPLLAQAVVERIAR